MRLQYSIYILLFLHCFSVQSQEFKNFTTEEGLPSNEVYGVFQDKNGAMWFSTDRGICQYNGYEFKKYEPKDGLTDITVFDFFPQENGQVWCTTFNKKIFYFENGSNHFVAYKYNHLILSFIKKYSRSSFFVKSLAVDSTGKLYISDGVCLLSISADGKVTELIKPETNLKKIKILAKHPIHLQSFRINARQDIKFFTHKPSAYSAFYLPSVLRSITSLTSDRKFIVTGKIVEIQQKNRKAVRIDIGKFQPIAGGKMDEKHVWVGYRSNGIKIYDFAGKCVASFLPHATVSNFFRDCYGGIWISTTDYGVYYSPPQSVQLIELNNDVVHSLTKDNNGTLFMGMYTGDIYKKEKRKPIERIWKTTVNFPAYIQFYEARNNIIYTKVNALYLGNQVLKKSDVPVTRISDDNKSVLSLTQYSTYTIWGKDKILGDTLNFRIHDISCVGNTIYFGTVDGLKVLENGIISQKKEPLFNYRIDDIDYSASKGILYAATLGKGLLVCNIQKNKVFAIDRTKGLSNDIVTEVYIENDNTIWACTNYGLNRIQFTSPTNYKVDYLSTANGLASTQIKDIEIIDDSIYIGTAKGLNTISKKQFDRLLSKKHYFLRLKDIYINDQAFKGDTEKLDLRHNDNQIDFMVEAVFFSERKKIEYRYKLEGLDKNWKNTQERKLSYEYIPPGDYKLLVRIIDDNRDLSEERIVLPIHISKPFWKTYWFLSIIGIAFCTIIYFFFKIRVLSYNKDIVRELLRLILKRIKTKDNYFTFKESGKEIRVKTSEILFVRSSGNYIDIITTAKNYTVRAKIGDFVTLVHDPLEFLRIHRSYIIRIDKVEQKSRKAVYIQQHEIPVGETYIPELDKILF